MEQQIADLHEIAFFGQVLDRVAAMEQHTLVAVDIGYPGFASAGGGIAGVEGEMVGAVIQLADIDDIGAQGS
jgi:hypothetical protein